MYDYDFLSYACAECNPGSTDLLARVEGSELSMK